MTTIFLGYIYIFCFYSFANCKPIQTNPFSLILNLARIKISDLMHDGCFNSWQGGVKNDRKRWAIPFRFLNQVAKP